MDRRGFVKTGMAALGAATIGSMLPRELLAEGQVTLKDAGAACGMKVGFACSKKFFKYSPPAYTEFVKANCNLISPETDFSWYAMHPMEECYRFDDADWLVDFAKQNGMAFAGGSLCTDSPNPPWMADYLTPANAESTLTSYIAKVAGRYADKMISCVVVNEPISTWFNKPGGLTPGPWVDALGPQYIDIAFHATAAAAPHVTRVLNLHHVEHAQEEQSRQASLDLIEGMIKRNVPVQAIGIQSHLDCSLPIDQRMLEKFIHSLRGMGVQVQITELDVNDAKVEGDFQHRDQVVADYYARYLDVVLPAAKSDRLVFWSPTDHSWLDYLCKAPQFKRSDGSCTHRPGLIDTSTMQTKLAYDAVIKAIQRNCTATH